MPAYVLPRATEAVWRSEDHTDIPCSRFFPSVTCSIFLTLVVKRSGGKRSGRSVLAASAACFLVGPVFSLGSLKALLLPMWLPKYHLI